MDKYSQGYTFGHTYIHMYICVYYNQKVIKIQEIFIVVWNFIAKISIQCGEVQLRFY